MAKSNVKGLLSRLSDDNAVVDEPSFPLRAGREWQCGGM